MTTQRRIGAYMQPWYGLDTTWMREGTCSVNELTTEQKRNFFADIERGADARRRELAAKMMCWECPVKGLCLDYAVRADMRGIWGGLNRAERKRLTAQEVKQARTI